MHPRWIAALCVAFRANSAAIPPSKRLASPAPRRSRCSCGFIHGLLVLFPVLLAAGCGRDSPQDGEPGEVNATGAVTVPPTDTVSAFDSGSATTTLVQPDTGATAQPDSLSATTTAAQSDSLSPSATPQTSPAPADSLALRLDGIMAAQERILARLDSMETGRATGPEGTATPGDGTAAADGGDEPGTLDLEDARDQVRNLGVGIFWSIVVVVFFHFAIRLLIWVLETLAERSVARRLTFKWLIPITRMLLWAIAAYLIVRTIFQVTAQGLLAASAALGVALGFAAQDLLKNVFGGLIVVFDKPFQVGDKISVGGTYGEVVSIGLRSTRIVTADDDLVTVPNSQVVQEQVANANAGQLNCQVVTDLYLPGRVDERRAKEIAFDAAVTSKYVFLDKPIQVFIEDQFRTTFVTHVKVRAYVLDPRFEFLLRSDITERARDGFRAAGLAPEHDWYPVGAPADASDPEGPVAP